jgi:hypothetical protein
MECHSDFMRLTSAGKTMECRSMIGKVFHSFTHILLYGDPGSRIEGVALYLRLLTG